MRNHWVPFSIAATACLLLMSLSTAVADEGPLILTEDVERFYQVYDAAEGHPAAADLQRLYVDAGTPGLREFAGLRQISGETLAAAIARNAAVFERARDCVPVLAKVRTRIVAALAQLKVLYPSAAFPPVTLLIGRGRSGGTTSDSGVLLALEMLCSAEYMAANVEDRFVQVIAHEYGHIQQPAADLTQKPGGTVLFTSLIEGGAELLGELICGSVGYPHLQTWTQGREAQLERRFVAERNQTDLSAWLYNGIGDAANPGDLGYWAGYRVAKAYYVRAKDKGKALAEILTVTPATAEQILKSSGIGK